MQRQVIFTATRASAPKLYNMPRYQSIFALLLVVAAGSGAACRTAMPDRQPLYHFPGAEVPPTGGPVLHAQPIMHETSFSVCGSQAHKKQYRLRRIAMPDTKQRRLVSDTEKKRWQTLQQI